MQHTPSFDTDIAEDAGHRGGLLLVPILGRAPDGGPILGGTEPAMALDPLPQGDPSSYLAVCKVAQMDGRLVVLGYVPLGEAVMAVGAAKPAQDITIGTGKAQIKLMRDGRVRITGEDVQMGARRRMRLKGATIDLN
ncbi:MAG: hypothetical protein AAGL89_17895 [Pseudomonadota bacterium]